MPPALPALPASPHPPTHRLQASRYRPASHSPPAKHIPHISRRHIRHHELGLRQSGTLPRRGCTYHEPGGRPACPWPRPSWLVSAGSLRASQSSLRARLGLSEQTSWQGRTGRRGERPSLVPAKPPGPIPRLAAPLFTGLGAISMRIAGETLCDSASSATSPQSRQVLAAACRCRLLLPLRAAVRGDRYPHCLFMAPRLQPQAGSCLLHSPILRARNTGTHEPWWTHQCSAAGPGVVLDRT